MDYESGKYENKVKFPMKVDFTKYYCYNAGKVIGDGVSYDEAKQIERENSGCIIEKYIDMKAYEKALQEHRNGAFEAEQRWRKDLEKEYGVSFDDKVIEIIFEKAWQDGHSNGLKEVENYFDEYLDMIKDILENAKDSEFIKRYLSID